MFEADSSGFPRRGLNSRGLVVMIFLSIFLAFLSPFRPAASQGENLSAPTSIFSSSEITDTEVLTFERPVLSKIGSYDFITMKGCGHLEDIGKPKLPSKNVFLLIPSAATLVDVEVTSLAEITLGDEYLIFPAHPPLPTTSENRSFVDPDPLIYKSSERYPKKLFSPTKTGNLGGHRVLGIRIFPVQYVPKSGEIIFHSKILIKVTYALNDTAPIALASPSTEFSGLVKKLVLNPESESNYDSSMSESSTAAEATLSSDDVKYVIITSESLKDNFQVLADWKIKKGIPAEVVTVSWITDNYSGVDNHEKIRNFIKDAAENFGTTWVLLGGDTNIIPVRKGYGEVDGAAAGTEVDYIPADLYYSDLDGNWNADNDGTYGEVEDNVDLYPDVFVGRAPVDSAAEAQTFVDKTLSYEKNPPVGYQESVLFLAEILNQSPYTDGGIAKDVIDDNYIPDGFSVTKLYESSGNLNHDTAWDNLNSGYGIVNHVGHANYNVLSVGDGSLYLSDMNSLTNSSEYSVFYSIGCWSAAMDRDSIGEHFVLAENGGGPVYVSNSRYGWYWPGHPGEGSSDRYDQEFFNSLFVENIYRVGETLADSKIEFIPESENDGDERWLQYALNLLGDPELPIWTEVPENLVVTHPSEILTGPRQVTVMVKDNDGNAVENALVCLQKDPDVYTYGYTNPSGEAAFSISPTSPGSLNVTVTKHNFIPYENTLNVLAQIENIVILHTNDIHSHLLPYESDMGGSAYIASIVDNEREQNPGRVLLLDAGDIIDGAPIGDLFYGKSVVEVMNAIGYDAMTVGNHELGRYGGDYDYGMIPIENDYLMDLKETAEFPMLAANVLIDNSKPFESYVIKEISGVKIGIIGVTAYFPPPENVQILDANSAAQQFVDEIENQVDLIIALTHLGLSGDESLASAVDGIDIVIGGHSHTVMWAPETVENTRIVQAGAYGKYVGRIFLEYDVENHEIDNFSYELIEVKHPPLEENEKIKEIVENYDNIISPIVDVIIGYTENAISGPKLGEMVAKSFRENTGADVGYQNYGGIRNYIPAGNIIIRQIHKVLPYGNKLMSMDLRGDYLKGEFSYGYVAGAYQENSQWYLENGEPIEDNEYYRVATNSYSGTRYGFTDGENITYHGLCRDAFIDYIRTIPENAYTLDLLAGWNLVGFTGVGENDTPNNLFPGLDFYTDYCIYYWDAPGGPYVLQDPYEVLDDNLGYWVWINQSWTVLSSGTPPGSCNIYLENGWNLVSFQVVNGSTTPNNIFTGLNYYTDYYLLWYLAPGGPYQLQGPNEVLRDDRAYWVWINQYKTVIVP